VERAAPPFTPAEYARAHALVDLAGTVAGHSALRWDLLLPSGAELTIRSAGPADLDELVELHARCSPASRLRRFLTAGEGPGRVRLARQLAQPHGLTLVAQEHQMPAPIVAVATAVWDGPEAEVGLLVQDDRQRAGLGTALLRRIARQAVTEGIEALHVHTHADNAPMIRTMRRLGVPIRHQTDSGIVTLTADIRVCADVPAPA
jgi:GNAT superfamily N-acetyltransferase